MDRAAWLADRLAAVVADYDATADDYDTDPYPNDAQVDCVRRLLAACTEGGLILDAPCGTGRYFDLVATSGRRVVGVDQSGGMLDRAAARGIATELHHAALQDLSLPAQFDAAITVDGMEHVAPEDWPVVLANVHATLLPGASWYITVEEADRARIADAFAALRANGVPAVLGEVTTPQTGGYHYYPERDQVLSWFAAEGLEVVDEAVTPYDGWSYRHFLLRDTRSL
jgi:cyclopropane fatty-acyl-phospholipid synthase-like methyltransferase